MQKVLFVDDEAPVRRAFQLVHGDFFCIEFAASYDEALQVLASDIQIAVVITDLKMPGKGGEQLALAVRKKYPLKKIVINTANLDMDTLKRSINNTQVDAFFEKVDVDPQAIQKVRTIIAKLLQDFRDGQ